MRPMSEVADQRRSSGSINKPEIVKRSPECSPNNVKSRFKSGYL